MPPGRSKTATETSGNGSKEGIKKVAAKKTARKSLAVDPTLYQSSSDEDDNQPSATAASRKPVKIDKIQSRTQSEKPKKAAPATAGASASPGSRRSTRLSGEGLPDPTLPTKTSATSKAPAKKRKLPPSPTAATQQEMVHPGQPTPPDTDEANAKSGNRSAATNEATSKKPTANGKKQKISSNNKAKSIKNASRVPTPPSESSDEDFVFTQLDEPPATAPAFSISSTSQTISSNAALQFSAPAASTSTSKPTKTKRLNKKSTNASTSVQLLESIQAVSGTSNMGIAGSQDSTAAAHNPSNKREIVDKKGKRKAEDTDTNISTAEEQPQVSERRNAASTVQAQLKPKTKKGKTAQIGLGRPEANIDADMGEEPGTPPTTVPVYSQETPAIQRNQAMRAGVPIPGTPGSASRRVSGDLRGRRGSSIGNGFEALPHPSIPSNTLHKHIRTTDPPAIRFRTLATWSMHRLKETLEIESKGYPNSIRDGARKAMESIINDLAEKKLSLTWPPDAGNDLPSIANLPPHPQNQSNQAKLEACLAWSARLKAEDEARNTRIKEYKAMTEAITRLAAPPIPIPAEGDAEATDLLTPDWSQKVPRLKTKEDILAFGQRLLQAKQLDAGHKGKQAEQDTPDDINVEAELGINLVDLRHQAASLHQAAYRLEQFLKIGDLFLKKHLAQSHLAVSLLTRPTDAHKDAHRPTNAGSSGASSSRVQGGDLEGFLPSPNPLAHGDPRELLRALSRAETLTKR